MKSIAKSNEARLQRGARSRAARMRDGAERSQSPLATQFEEIAVDSELSDADIDLENLDFEGVEDEEGADADWLADRDFAMEIARQALH